MKSSLARFDKYIRAIFNKADHPYYKISFKLFLMFFYNLQKIACHLSLYKKLPRVAPWEINAIIYFNARITQEILMKFLKAEPEAVVTYDELGDGWKFAKSIRQYNVRNFDEVSQSGVRSRSYLRRVRRRLGKIRKIYTL